MEEKIRLLRERIVSELSKLEDGIHVKLDYEPLILDLLLFEKTERGKKFIIDDDILKKIDFSNVIFDNFNADNFDFSKLYNVTLNPQILWAKSLHHSILKGVRFNGPFNNVMLDHTSFKGSIGAHINPNTVYREVYHWLSGQIREQWTKLEHCDFDGVTFTAIIDCNKSKIDGSSFKGSINAKIKMGKYGMDNCILDGVTLIGNINIKNEYDRYIYNGVDFTNSKSDRLFDNRVILYPRNAKLKDTKLNGVKIIGDFDNATLIRTDFTGSIGAIVDLRVIKKESEIYTCNFTDAIVIDEFGKKITINESGKIANSIEEEINKLLNIEYENIEEQRKNRLDGIKKEIAEKTKELLLLLENCERLGIEPRHLYHTIPVTTEQFLIPVGDHFIINKAAYEIEREITENGKTRKVKVNILRFLNLSQVDFSRALVVGFDFRETGAEVYPQTVYNKDFRGCKFDSENIRGSLNGCDARGSDLSEVPFKVGIEGAIIDETTILKKDEKKRTLAVN